MYIIPVVKIIVNWFERGVLGQYTTSQEQGSAYTQGTVLVSEAGEGAAQEPGRYVLAWRGQDRRRRTVSVSGATSEAVLPSVCVWV